MKALVSVGVLACLLAVGCAPKKSAFVLVPDREDRVGAVTVTNAKGSAVVDRAGDAVLVAGPDSAPERPVPFGAARIQRTFGAALAAEPAAPLIAIVYFASGSSALEPASALELDKAVAEIRRRDSRDVSIDGHTDTTGDPQSNLRISLERARAVQEYLVRAGVKVEWMTVSYHGKGNPLVPTADNVDEPRNRRVEVIVR
jgi:outer membrane protein OmpA-like peptidoglycan-associated protein